jgi:hypothetical protein
MTANGATAAIPSWVHGLVAVRHCERSEAIHFGPGEMDCFAALAMTN